MSGNKTTSAIKLSILIPTLPERYSMFYNVTNNIREQLRSFRLLQSVEILHDPSESKTIGDKRQALIDRSRGEYVVFIDDDDDITTDYIHEVMKGIESGVDVIGMIGEYYVDGIYKKPFRHSIGCGTDASGNPYWEDDKQYYRCPNHLNPMKRSLATQAYFMSSNHGEDTDFAMQIYKKQLLKSEYMIDTPIYKYYYRTKK